MPHVTAIIKRLSAKEEKAFYHKTYIILKTYFASLLSLMFEI